MDSSSRTVQCVVVTPERAVLDEAVDFVALPMYDGELGVLPGRAPLIGRLGFGELCGQSLFLFLELFCCGLKAAFDQRLFGQCQLELFPVLRAKVELHLLSHHLLCRAYGFLELTIDGEADCAQRFLKVFFEMRLDPLKFREHPVDLGMNRGERVRRILRPPSVTLMRGAC